MIKNSKKNTIKDLYSPFRYKEIPETDDRIDGRTAVSDVISRQNGNYRSFIVFFLSFFIIYLTVKLLLTDFFFSLRKFSLPPPLHQYLYKTEALSVLHKPD